MDRGVIEIQLNWVFILIAGAMIVVFFITLVGKLKGISDDKLAEEVVTQMELILSGAMVSESTVHTIKIPDIPFEVSCESYTFMGANRIFGNSVVFAPDHLEGDRMTTWTEEWEMPYKVTRFLFMTSPRIRYILVYTGDIGSQSTESAAFMHWLNRTLPDERLDDEDYTALITKDIASWNQISNLRERNNYKVRLIFYDDGTNQDFQTKLDSIPSEFDNFDLSGVVFRPTGTAYGSYGEVTFLEHDQPGSDTTYFLGAASILAALFSEDAEQYNCAMDKAFVALRLVSDVYENRTSQLEVLAPNRCSHAYTQARSHITTGIKGNAAGFPPQSGALTKIQLISDAAMQLNKTNPELLHQSCPRLY